MEGMTMFGSDKEIKMRKDDTYIQFWEIVILHLPRE
jgi:hypothetical protein